MKNLITYCATIIISLGICLAQTPQKIRLGFANGSIVRFSPKSDLLAFAVGSKIKLFQSGIEVAYLQDQSSKITSLNFDVEGDFIMAGFKNGKVAIWNILTKEIIGNFYTSDSPIIACQFIESTRHVVVLHRKSITVYTTTGDMVKSFDASPHSNFTSLAVSTNGKIIAVGSNNNIELYSNQGNKIETFETNHPHLLSLAFSRDGKKLASGGNKGKVNLWNIKHLSLEKELINTVGRINNLEFSSDGKYLATGAESFFLLSLTEQKHSVAYKQQRGAILSSAFSPNGKQLCLIEDLTSEAKLYDISDLKIPPVFRFKDDQDVIAPQIYVSNPQRITNDRVNYSKDIIDITGSIFDDFGVRSLKINSIETPIRDNGKFLIHLPLAMGENHITLEASDINGNTSVKRFIINRKSHIELYDHTTARNFLFVIGIDEYQNWPVLNNAVKDGNDMASILMVKYGFEFSNITILKNEQATKSNVYKGLRSMIEQITPQDNLIIYFSGHGHFDELLNEGFWIPVDANLDTETDYLSNSSILKIIENIRAQHTFLIADACFSGSLFVESQRAAPLGYVETVEKIKSRWGLASGRLEAVSDGIAGGNSPFAHVLLQFLKHTDKTKFAVTELIQHVKFQVSEESGQTPIGNPLRLTGHEGGEFIFRANNHSNLVSSGR